MILFIHCKRGLYQLTICSNCKHKWQCDQCSANLITYRQSKFSLELLCHQCQTSYSYPTTCPKCSKTHIISTYGGVDDLVENLQAEYKKDVIRYDKIIKKTNLNIINNNTNDTVAVSTRIYDPAIDYSQFTQIVFVQAEFLLASADYMVTEEITKNLADLFIAIDKNKTTIYFDTKESDNQYFKELIEVEDIGSWYKNFIEKEVQIREAVSMPPNKNLLLITAHTKKEVDSINQLKILLSYIDTIKSDFKEITFTKNPYKAKLLKRKGLYSYHILIKYPRGYEKFVALKKLLTPQLTFLRLQARINPNTVL
jgi:primosomal protein N' (replication factor Y) (superfamily II helicase)